MPEAKMIARCEDWVARYVVQHIGDRARRTVRFHKEDDYGYEAGFRCCADAR